MNTPRNPAAHCAFALIEQQANEAATGKNCRPLPTPAQSLAGNYKMGRVRLHGLDVRIENVRGSVRSGTGPTGKQWQSRMAAHYGYIAGTRGADGDAVDVFVGPFPESQLAWVINQGDPKGGFDEHKVMLGFASEAQARAAYLDSYERGWRGLKDIVALSLTQLKWWLSKGNKARAISPDQLPHEGETTMDQVRWNGDAEPLNTSLPRLIYAMRRADDEGLLLDSLSVDDLMTDPDIEARLQMDAMVVEVGMLQRKMEQLNAVMKAAAATVQPVDFTIADPVKMRGTMQIAVVFAMDDGQAVTVWFHNPDTTPAKLTPMDELVSWKWMLNKKDVTIWAAPERGRDLNAREVARRIMKLVEKNSEAFKRANARAADLAAQHAAIDAEIPVLEAELAKLQEQVEVARIAKGDGEIAPVPSQTGADANAAEMRAAIEKHGLPAETEFSPGKGAMGAGKWIAKAQGNQGNLADSIDQAAASLALFLKQAAKSAELALQRVALAKAVAEKLKQGVQPTDVELRDLFGLQPQHSYVDQSAVGQFLVDYMGVSRNAIRASLGAAAGFRVSDGGAKYPIVYPRKLHEVFGPGATVPAVVDPLPPAVVVATKKSLEELAQELADVLTSGGYAAYSDRRTKMMSEFDLSTRETLDLGMLVEGIVGAEAMTLARAKFDPFTQGQKAWHRGESEIPPAGLSEEEAQQWIAGWTDRKQNAEESKPDPVVEPGEVVGEATEVQPVADLPDPSNPLAGVPTTLLATLDGTEVLSRIRSVYDDGEPIPAHKQVFDAARGYFRSELQGNTYRHTSIGDIKVNGSVSWGKVKRGLTYNLLRVKLLAAIPNLLRKGYHVGTEPTDKTRPDSAGAFHHLVGWVSVGGLSVEVGVSLAEMEHGRFMYNLSDSPSALLAKKQSRIVKSGESPTDPALDSADESAGDGESVAQDGSAVKQEVALDDAGGLTGVEVLNFYVLKVMGADGQEVDDLADQEEGAEPVGELTPTQKVDEAYRFGQATDRFKQYIAETVADPDYSMFATAKAIDEAAKARGASVSWDVEEVAAFDSVEPGVDGSDGASATGDDVILDGVAHAISALQNTLNVVENNEPINRSEGKTDQADLEAEVGRDIREALGLLQRHGTTLDRVEPGAVRTVVGRIVKDGAQAGVATIAGDGKAIIYVGDLGGERVKDSNGAPAPRGSDPESLVKWLLESSAVSVPDPEPAPAPAPPVEDGNVAVLRSILAGESDSAHLSLTLATIEACVNALNDAGLLTGDVEQLAQDAITYWANLDEKVNG